MNLVPLIGGLVLLLATNAAAAEQEQQAMVSGYDVRESRILKGAIQKRTPNVEDLQACATACTAHAGCNSFTYIPSQKICEFKAESAFNPDTYSGYISGIAVGASSTVVFTNTSGSTVTMYFVDAQGKEDPDPYTQIANDAQYTQPGTKVGQSWRFKIGTTLVAEYKVLPYRQQAFSIPFAAVAPGYDVKTSRILKGAIQQRTPNVEDLQACAAACTAHTGCNSFTYIPSAKVCEFKADAAFESGDYRGYISGVAVDLEYRRWLAKDQPRYVQKYPPLSVDRFTAMNITPLDVEQVTANGYHVFRLNPLKLAQRGTIGAAPIFESLPATSTEYHLDAGVFTPNTFVLTPLNDTAGKESTDTFFSQSERTDKFSLNVSLEVGKPTPKGEPEGPKVGGKYSQEESNTSSSAMERTVMMATRWGAKFTLTALKERMKLSEPFKANVRALRNGDYRAYVKFFESFGTHYALRAMLGGIAFYEKSYSVDEIGKAISRTTSASVYGTVPVKAVEISTEVGFTQSKEHSSKEKKSLAEGYHWAAGGSTGAGYESWSLGDMTKDYEAIKVDLREIWELIWPEKMGDTDAASSDNTRAIQQTMKTMLARYMDEEQRSISESPSYRPRVFSVRIDSIKLTEDLDDGYNGPDFWGYVSLYAARRNPSMPPKGHPLLGMIMNNFGTPFYFVDHASPGCIRSVSILPSLPADSVLNQNAIYGCDRWKNFGTDLADTMATVPTKSITSDFSDVDKNPLFVSIAPTVVKVAGPQGNAQYKTSYDLSQYRLFPVGYLRDDDDGGENADDIAQLLGADQFTLQEVVDAGGSKTGKVSSGSVPGLGTVEVTYTVKEINFTVQVDKLDLPAWPPM